MLLCFRSSIHSNEIDTDLSMLALLAGRVLQNIVEFGRAESAPQTQQLYLRQRSHFTISAPAAGWNE